MTMNNLIAPIYSISRLRIGIDGNGIRTLICFQGCPLKCKYCINNNSKTINNNQLYSVKNLINYVSIDNIYFQSTNGGITFGGGEPLLYSKFILEFINKSPKEWNYWIETSLNVPWKNVEILIDKIDKYVIDIKSINPMIYKKYTDKDNEQVIDNLITLKEIIDKDKIIIRIPFIEGYTTEKDCQKSIEFIKDLGIKNIDYFKYKIR